MCVCTCVRVRALAMVSVARRSGREHLISRFLMVNRGCLQGYLGGPARTRTEYITLTTAQVIPSQWANTSKSRLLVICGGRSAPVSPAREFRRSLIPETAVSPAR